MLQTQLSFLDLEINSSFLGNKETGNKETGNKQTLLIFTIPINMTNFRVFVPSVFEHLSDSLNS